MGISTGQELIARLWYTGEFGTVSINNPENVSWVASSSVDNLHLQNTDMFFGVHPSDHRKRYGRIATDDVIATNCVYAEFDLEEYGSKQAILSHIDSIVDPSVIVSSGGGYHAYWLLPRPLQMNNSSREYMRYIQYNWVKWCGGDIVASDLSRCLRIPGTINTKPQYNRPVVTIVYSSSVTYSANYLASKLPKPQPTPKPEYHQTCNPNKFLDKLQFEIEHAPVGTRNCTLNRCAFVSAYLVPLIDEVTLSEILLMSAIACGLTQQESVRTIRSGLSAGLVKLNGRTISSP